MGPPENDARRDRKRIGELVRELVGSGCGTRAGVVDKGASAVVVAVHIEFVVVVVVVGR